MSAVYDNWERLVRATLSREDLRRSGLRTPSDISSASQLSASPSIDLSSQSQTVQFSSFNSGSLIGDSFTYVEILEATDFLSASNLIKRGHSGDFYFGVLESGVQVVIKKIHVSSQEAELCLMSELEICGMVYHPRMIPLLGYCLDCRNDKFLVYKYMANKDLSYFLDLVIVWSSDDGIFRGPLNWIRRLKIAIGAAEGLCHLHHQCFPPLVHRDIQASSFLLDADLEVHLGSLTQVCIEEKDNNQSRFARFLRLPKGSEQRNSGTSNATCAYDVYCFGIVLLEIVTGEYRSDATGSIMKAWMEHTLQYINPQDKRIIINIVDPSLIKDDHDLMEIWSVAFVAKSCLKTVPSKRPKMEQVLKALRGIKPASSTVKNLQRSVHPNSGIHEFLVANDTEKVNPRGDILEPHLYTFTYLELKNATKDFSNDTFLGEGEFGRVHKGWVHHESTTKSGTQLPIAVKRCYDYSAVGVKDWKSEMELHGKISHPNIVKLLGYCLENEELLLVYEFMHEGSLENHLFGGSNNPLTWERRIRILLDAARGLAFLHELQRRGLIRQAKGSECFFANFKPSNVLLDQSYKAKIADFGSSKNPKTTDLPLYDEVHPKLFLFDSNRAAPEYIRAGDLSLKTDVYSFGILLAEMLTGLRAVDMRRSRQQRFLLDWIKPYLFDRRKVFSILDSKLESKYPEEAVMKMSELARICLVTIPEYRPSMEEVVQVLELVESTNGKTLDAGLNSKNQIAYFT